MIKHVLAAGAVAAVVAQAAPAAAQAQAEQWIGGPSASANPAREEGDRLVGLANAAGVFSNESKPGGPIVLRHKASGLLCRMEPGKPGNRLLLNPKSKPGQEILCATQAPFMVQVFTATEVRSQMTLEIALDMTVKSIRKEHPDAQVFDPPEESRRLMARIGTKLPPHRTAIFRIGNRYERASVIIIDGWLLHGRFASELLAGVTELADLGWVAAIGPAAEAAARKAP